MSTDAEEALAFNVIEHPCMISLSKPGIENFLNLLKNIYKKPQTTNIIFNCYKLDALPLKLGLGQGHFLSYHFYSALYWKT